MPAEPTAADLLSRVAARYASAKSYRDTGEVRSISFVGPPWGTETVVWRPQFDVDIDVAVFEFEPPP